MLRACETLWSAREIALVVLLAVQRDTLRTGFTCSSMIVIYKKKMTRVFASVARFHGDSTQNY